MTATPRAPDLHTEATPDRAAERPGGSAPVYLLPGWLNSDPDHWQSQWERRWGDVRVEQADWQWPRRGDWMARLDEVLQQDPRLDQQPALLVAHSLGCQLVASWADHSQHTARVAAALLVAPPDTERDDMPPQLHNWKPIRRSRLPFPTLVVVSSDDPYCSLERASGMAADWGAQMVMAGALGHMNAASGLGEWPQGRSLLHRIADNRAPW
ncbi:alpha/beta hydrolase [Roseateles sp. SL47]|uniref:RBBP9/YdeN family alpha/beta hydrolase n=1 Tax=Roseateles sp. SL47 TaxID=2995138 RepID=UPI00226D8F2E|nr:alpha/beta hydrolase [Roseateles sp. SL47]WAC74068.1 alpha/beta hydrolase [Roseateles sp. SL47]